MATLFRSATKAGLRFIAVRPKTLTSKVVTPRTSMSSPFTPITRSPGCASRLVMALGSVESLMPLHSAIASARLKSIIAVDSSCWSWLSQGLALPL
ncbi:PREDICTED: uncharacterized protein LOC104601773 isoform X1 [Nelumbo nucifera]|uniref:Uncharacterized protein LOC104601773 isoform X1 n=1 Tax=Nelumbo nucifera TaxID=4432 RepID=A0A1U8A874_NELNU|nr:PREDICTED: uncharacterized protein LOC104601773 isoform X1 [Nelumbo nucifera]